MKRNNTIKTEYLQKYSPIATQIGILYVAPATIGEVLDLPKDQSSIDHEEFGKEFFKNHVKVDKNDKELEPISEVEINKLHSIEIWNLVQTIYPGEDRSPLDIDSGPTGNPYKLLTKNLYDQKTSIGKINNKIGKSLNLTGLVSDDIKRAIDNNIIDLKRITDDSKNHIRTEHSFKDRSYLNIFYDNKSKPIDSLTNLFPRPPLVSHAQRTADAVEASLQELADVAHRTENMARSMAELTGTVGRAVQQFMINIDRQKLDAELAFAGPKLNLRIAVIALVISAALPAIQMFIEYRKSIEDTAREQQQDDMSTKQLATLEDIREGIKSKSNNDTPIKFDLSEQALRYTRPE
ncbi:hypothetical protein [Pseudomonas oryzihabitans]|uniref:hypothetical protein n=1 Tax=Pseudomonas oryzihabitans TaxID=47885 RepID=UPI00289CA950|nr:hypothetical protein [Pseudomonas oryzihabitans]